MSRAPLDTIAAIATAPGRAGVGVIRLSGPAALSIWGNLVRPRSKIVRQPKPFVMYRVDVLRESDGFVLDDGLAVWMPQGRSFTGEDTLELHLHGSPLGLSQVLSEIVSRGTIRLAEAGEFSRRAFLSGRMKLIDAEAVAELIHAESEAALRAAQRRRQGQLSQELETLYSDMTGLLAECEADIDFPDEALPVKSREGLAQALQHVRHKVATWLEAYPRFQHLQDGLSVAIVGPPNVGKSSLFNALLKQDRALVSSLAGTTRDYVSETLVLQGRRVRFLDTAGLRPESPDELEVAGMERTRALAAQADVIWWVLAPDVVSEAAQISTQLTELRAGQRLVFVINKCDVLGGRDPMLPAAQAVFRVSAKTGEGLDALMKDLSGDLDLAYTQAAWGEGLGSDRQYHAMKSFLRAFDAGVSAWEDGVSIELAAFELRQAHLHLADLLGMNDPSEDVLTQVFGRFCVGK